MTKAKREFLANFGDVNWVEHGGLLLFKNEYGYTAYKVDLWPYDVDGNYDDLYHPDMRWNIIQFEVEKWYLFDDQLVDSCGNPDWINPHIESICNCVGISENEFISLATSDNPLDQLGAHEAIGSYMGFCELSCGYEDYVTAKELKKDWFPDIMDGSDLDLRYCRTKKDD